MKHVASMFPGPCHCPLCICMHCGGRLGLDPYCLYCAPWGLSLTLLPQPPGYIASLLDRRLVCERFRDDYPGEWNDVWQAELDHITAALAAEETAQ